MKVGVFKLHRF